MNVVCVGAHPDDLEIGCGGTILRHVNRGDLVVSIVMSGSELRVKEAKEVGKVLGVQEVNVGHFFDRKVPASLEAIKVIEQVIERVGAHRVYTHTTKDTHQDHRNTALATLSAARNVPQILFYESAPPKSWAFTPNYYVDISKYVEKKIESIKLFRSQSHKWYMKTDVLRSMASFRGLEIGVAYAEAFEIYKILDVEA